MAIRQSIQTCRHCGQRFLPTPHPRGRVPYFCSAVCRQKASCAIPRKKHRGACAWCGKKFSAVNPNTRHCSMTCGQATRNRKLGFGRVELTCRGCGKRFVPKKGNRKTYCSRECGFA